MEKIDLSVFEKLPEAKDLVFDLQKNTVNLQKINQIKKIDEIIKKEGVSSLEVLKNKNIAKEILFEKATFLFGEWICDLSCPNYCYTKGQKNGALSAEETIKVIKQLHSRGLKYTYWPGSGEVTLLPDFWEVMNYQSKVGIPSIVFTNGNIFHDERLSKKYLNSSCSKLIDRFRKLKNLHFYVKVWATEEDLAREMTGAKKELYPYEEYLGTYLPKSFKILHEIDQSRVGVQMMVTSRNYLQLVNNILPLHEKHDLRVFCEPIILSGAARNNEAAKNDLLNPAISYFLKKVFVSGGSYCERRQYTDLIFNGRYLAPGIALPPRNEDFLKEDNLGLESILQIFFNSYFREMRYQSDINGGCLCRNYWEK